MDAKENLLRVIRHDHPEWVPNGMETVAWLWPPVVERPGSAGKDIFGCEWSLEEGAHGGTFPKHGGHTITDLRRWREQITPPNLDQYDWSNVVNAAKSVDRSKGLTQGFIEMGLFERSYLLLGMDEALINYILEPDLMYELIGYIADYKIRFIEKFDDLCDLDMIWYGDDWGTQTNLFMPPDTWRKVIKPHTQRLYDVMKQRNIIINQHSCGKIEAVFDDMVKMGAHIWNPCQPCNDLAMLKKNFHKKIAYWGGIDSQFVLDRPGVTTDDVRREVRRRIDELAKDGGYMAAPSHGVPYNPEIIAAMNDEINTYGHAYYRK